MMRQFSALAALFIAALLSVRAQADGLVFLDKPQPIPDIAFQDGDGVPHHLQEFRGKTILLNLWATWCLPCRDEMPTLDRLQARLGSDRFQVVTLSIDIEGVDRVKKFFAELNIAHLPVYVDPTTMVAADLGASGLPTTLLINPDGQEIARLIGSTEWDSPEMQATLKQHMPAN